MDKRRSAGERAVFRAKLLLSAAKAAGRRLVRGARHESWPLPYELLMAVIRDTIREDHGRYRNMMRRQVGKVPASLARRVALSHESWAGVACEVHTPEEYRAGGPTLLYLHGGGYVTCSPASHRELCARLALVSGARCVVPDYRLAPEHPFPAGLDDALAVYGALLARGVDPRALFLSGDSAGGGLALAAALRLRERHLPMPRALLLLSPWVDLSLDARALHGPLDYLNAAMLTETAPQYAGGLDLKHPLISPLHADLSGLPPMLVQTGGWEVFHEQNVRFVAKARASGVDVRHEVADAMLHVFPAFGALLPEGRRAIASFGATLRSFSLAPAARLSGEALGKRSRELLQ